MSSRPTLHRSIDPAVLTRIYDQVDHADALNDNRLPYEAHDRAPSPADGWWLVAGAVSALLWLMVFVWVAS